MTRKAERGDPLLREYIVTAHGPYFQEWYCPVPPEGSNHMVVSCDWLADPDRPGVALRRIYQTGPP